MVVVFECALAVLAYGSVIVATLRAGSRALYLTEHDSIGVLQGPAILGPDQVRNRSDASPLWDLAFPFQVAVRLAIFPETFDYSHQIEDDGEGELVDSHYSLSPHSTVRRPLPTTVSQVNVSSTEDEFIDDDVGSVIELLTEEAQHETKLSILRHYMYMPATTALRTWDQLQKSITPTLNVAKSLLSNAEWKFWQRRQREEDEDFDWEEEDWDYRSTLSTIIDFNNTSGDNTTARITAYAPETFADLRARFGISETNFITSMLEAGPYVSFQSNSKGAARSGGVFFFTRDGAYMIKTIKKEESKTFLEMLSKYHHYMRRNGRRSLLTRFCGMYKVKLTSAPNDKRGIFTSTKDKEHVFVIMNSVFPAEGSQFISERYDLKGSTVGRECSEEEKAKKGSNAVLKDLDIAREVEMVRSVGGRSRRSNDYGFHLGATHKAALLSQLRNDVKLLIECQVMDYSLLVGVANMDTGHFDFSALEAVEKQQTLFRRLSKRQRRAQKLESILYQLAAPIHTMAAPLIYFGRKALSLADSTLSSVLTLPLPYYGAGLCAVDGGGLAMIDGARCGKHALYYLGLIDFLQPWTTRKVVERQLKGLLGYDIHAISCVSPEEYASRFLEFIDSHVS